MSRIRADDGEVKSEQRPGTRLVEPTLAALDALDVAAALDLAGDGGRMR